MSKVRRISAKIRKFKQKVALISTNESYDAGLVMPGSSLENTDVNTEYQNTDVMTSKPSSQKVQYSAPDKYVRKRNYCLFCDKLIAKFGEHLERAHREKDEVKPLLEANTSRLDKQSIRLKKMQITAPLRKLWNSVYNNKLALEKPKEAKNKMITVKKTVSKDKSHVKCDYCHGQYVRNKFSTHLKSCSEYLNICHNIESSEKTRAIKEHSTLIIPYSKSVSNAFQTEILKGINHDSVMEQALNDELIMKFGSEFHHSRREPNSKNYIIREIRDLSRLVSELKSLVPSINCLKDCINPAHFEKLIQATLNLAGYEAETGSVSVSSIAYRLLQPLKDVCKILKTDYLKSLYSDGKVDRNEITIVDDFLDNLEDKWAKLVGRICSKQLKKSKLDKCEKMALDSDIVLVANYIESSYRKIVEKMKIETGSERNKLYDLLMHMLVSHIMLLVRRRPVDFKHAKLDHYNNLDKHDELIEMVKNSSSTLTVEQLESCKKFHIFYVPGKNLEVVPIVLTPLMKFVFDILISERSNVGISKETLFVQSKGRLIQPDQSLKLMARKVKLKKPQDLTCNGLRHQAATFSKLQSSHPQYQDFLASCLGHTLSVHKKHYDLPSGILQKIMVCPILHNIMKGQSSAPQERTHEREDIGHMTPTKSTTPDLLEMENQYESMEYDSGSEAAVKETEKTNFVKKKAKWTDEEQNLVLKQFGKNILRKEKTRRRDIVKFYLKNKKVLKNRTIPQIVMYIRNHQIRNQCDVTPKVKRILGLD